MPLSTIFQLCRGGLKIKVLFMMNYQ